MSFKQTSSHQSASRVFCCFVTSLLFVIVFPTLCISLILRLRAGGELSYMTPSLGYTSDENRTIFLHADLISANILQDSAFVRWTVDGDTCYGNCTEINIFFDTNISSPDDDDHSPYNNNRPTHPTFIWNASNGSEYDPRRNTPVFYTTIHIYSEYTAQVFSFKPYLRNLVYYPFDSYNAAISAFAQDAVTNDSVSLIIDSECGSVVDLEITIVSLEMEEDTDDMSVVTLKRRSVVVVYCLIITITFWLVTLTICLIMITTVVFGYRQRNEIVVVPIGTVFAFTQLRSTMPGAPEGFGDVLDFVGLLPCFVLLSICAVTMVGIYLFADPHDPSRKTFSWDELVNVLRFYIRRIWNTANAWAQRARFCIRIARRKSSNVNEIPSANLDC